jgi:hypothetical protein
MHKDARLASYQGVETALHLRGTPSQEAGSAGQAPGTSYASSAPGHGGMVTPTAASGPLASARNWKCVPAGMDTHVPDRRGTISCRSACRRHI